MSGVAVAVSASGAQSVIERDRLTVGAVGLAATGLSLLAISILLTPWKGPHMGLWVDKNGAGLAWGFHWP